MKAFFSALRTHTVASQLYTDLGGSIYTDESPQNTDVPYAIWSFPSGIPNYDLEDKTTEDLTAQLDIYARTEAQILELFDESDASFNDCSFSVTGYELTRFRRIAQRKIKEDSVRRYIIDYSISIGEN